MSHPRRSRQVRSRRRRAILRALHRQGTIANLEETQRGTTVWITSPQMDMVKEQIKRMK